MGDLVAEQLRQLVVRGVELADEAAVERHLAAGHAPSVHRLRLVDERHAPVPIAGVREHRHRLADEPAGDPGHAVREQRIIEELVVRAQVPQGGGVGALRFDDGRLGRHEQELGAPGWARRAGAEQGDGEKPRQRASHHAASSIGLVAPLSPHGDGSRKPVSRRPLRRGRPPGRRAPSRPPGAAPSRVSRRRRPRWPRCSRARRAGCP